MNKIKIFALGGLAESGKNMYVVNVNEEIFIFDAGLKYPTSSMFGVDYIIPNIDYLKENESKIKGVFLTNAHDENIGAVGELIRNFNKIKIYGSTFTIEILKRRIGNKENFNIVEPHQTIKFGLCNIFPITVTHNIPGSLLYVLNTPNGAIVHAGNFVFDVAVFEPFKMDVGKLAYVGKQGVLCLLSESNYADKIGYTAPKNRINKFIKETLHNSEDRILFSVYTSNVYRLSELLTEVAKTKRTVVLLGRELLDTVNYLIDNGQLNFDKTLLGNLTNINDKNVVVVINNDRYKPFNHIRRIINGFDKFVKLKSTDTVCFLENTYLGTEKALIDAIDEISKSGSNVVTLDKKEHLLHHASKEDLMLMLNLMNPKYYFPVKGDYKLIVDNANVAKEVGYDNTNTLTMVNGEVAVFENGVLREKREKIGTDDVLIDGLSSEDVGELVIKDREVLSDNGIVIISASIDKKTKKIIIGPEIQSRGFIYVKDNIDIINEIRNISSEVISSNINDGTVDYSKIRLGLRDAVIKYLHKETGTRPMIISVVQEININ